jgi:hypothetical protein
MRAAFAGDENESDRARSMQVGIQTYQKIHPSTWVLLAHEGWTTGKRPRGSSAQPAAFDSMISIERNRGSDEGTITHHKLRNGLEVRPFRFRFVGPETAGGPGFEFLGEREREPGELDDSASREEHVLATLAREGGRASRARLIEVLGQPPTRYSDGQIDRTVERLEDGKKIRREKEGREVGFILVKPKRREDRDND